MIWIILAVAFIVGLVFLIFRTKKQRIIKKQNSILENLQIPGIPKDWANSEATPGGMRVMWNVNPFNSDAEKSLAFECFDIGYKNAFNSMKDRFPTWDFNLGFVSIGIIEPTAKNLDGSMALLTRGTIDPVTRKEIKGQQIAGGVIGTGDGYPLLSIIIPSQKENGWRYTDMEMRIIRHEYEHLIEYRSDSVIYMQKSGQVPGMPDAHPHWDYPEGVEEIPAPQPLNAPRGLATIKVPYRCANQVKWE
jgi:hypothetical protein